MSLGKLSCVVKSSGTVPELRSFLKNSKMCVNLQVPSQLETLVITDL